MAKVFEQIRISHRLSRLKRIRSRKEQEEGTCNISVRGLGTPYSNFGNALYKTSTPEIATSELEKIASVDRRWYRRYSVAVWPARGDDSTATFWVSIYLYSSAGVEFVDNYLTDDLFYKDDWKQRIAPECKKVH